MYNKKNLRMYVVVIGLAFAVMLSGCQIFASEPTPTKPDLTYNEALACVEENLPAQSYMTNGYLPENPTVWEPLECEEVIQISVGMPWVLNDEEAPWYNAVELGYYKDVCLDVELVPGGPGKDHIQTLGGGAVDIAVTAGGQTIPAAVASTTPIDIVAVGTFLKGMPYCFLTIDEELVERELTPLDLVDRTLAIQPASEVYAHMMTDKYGIARSKVNLMEAGWTPDPILVGKADFYAAWIVNQPRLLEEKGYEEWNALMYRDWVYDEYSDVIAARRETLQTEEGQEMVRRFLAATHHGIRYLLDNPEHSAEIAVKHATEPITVGQAEWRFAQQRDLVIGRDTLGLMAMDPKEWNRVVATLVQYNQIEIPCGK